MSLNLNPGESRKYRIRCPKRSAVTMHDILQVACYIVVILHI